MHINILKAVNGTVKVAKVHYNAFFIRNVVLLDKKVLRVQNGAPCIAMAKLQSDNVIGILISIDGWALLLPTVVR